MELPAIYCWEEFMSGVGSRNAGAPLYYKSQIQNGYPPWKNDDKDGHYVFVIRETLTLRYKILSKMGEGTLGQVLECLDNELHENSKAFLFDHCYTATFFSMDIYLVVE
ncbi:hypothetical protein MKW98_021443 [Papaver atlanticum]|uniref:Uncharacterized protein n=1 Tax=Papaver atlanticum TaxID=357466 RepID=A0AAD4SRX4_9MAGN|nr:hypothetical protein MKW98_021443 [Papaver atlanticum]